MKENCEETPSLLEKVNVIPNLLSNEKPAQHLVGGK